MIVWLASYPRSGNTFTRIVLHHIYGVDTYTRVAVADDLNYDKGAGDLTGHRVLSELAPDGRDAADWAGFIEELDQREEVYFVKTHAPANKLGPGSDKRTILLVRNGMDVFVSLANYFVDVLFTWPRFFKTAASLRPSNMGWKIRQIFRSFLTVVKCSSAKLFGKRTSLVNGFLEREIKWESWKHFHEAWLDRGTNNLAVIRFDDLIADPIKVITGALTQIDVPIAPKGGKVPTFEELKAVHPKFFRKGRSGTWKTEFPEALQPQFWESFGPIMERLGLDSNN